MRESFAPALRPIAPEMGIRQPVVPVSLRKEDSSTATKIGSYLMDIENIKCFISLAECLNFTKAAEKEHTTQTSMSRKINSLESELHVTLFHRDRRSVKLTSAGTEFYTQAKKLIELYDQSVQTVQNIHCGLIRELKIGLGLYEDALIQSYIDSYMAQNPSVRVSCLQFRYHQLLEQFQENMLDISFLMNCLPDRRNSISSMMLRG